MKYKIKFLFFVSIFIFSCEKVTLDADCEYFEYNITSSLGDRDTVNIVDYKTPYTGIFEYIGFTHVYYSSMGVSLYMRPGFFFANIPDLTNTFDNGTVFIPINMNQKIDSTFQFNYKSSYFLYNMYPPFYSFNTDSLFAGKGDKYIGFRVKYGDWYTSNDYRYGWMKINLSEDGKNFHIYNGAINKNLNEPVFAGKCN